MTAHAIPERAWILLQSGKRLDLLDPHPQAWDDEDLASRLASTYRWSGHSRWGRPLSVAQHSLTVLALRTGEGGRALSAAARLRELLHDAEEGLLGYDPISPLKPHLGVGFRDVVARLTRAVAQRYRLPPWTPASHAAHKRADRLAAASEAAHVFGWPPTDIRNGLGIEAKPLQDDPLATPPGMQPWEPWPPEPAAAAFLAMLRELLAERQRSRGGQASRQRVASCRPVRSAAGSWPQQQADAGWPA